MDEATGDIPVVLLLIGVDWDIIAAEVGVVIWLGLSALVLVIVGVLVVAMFPVSRKGFVDVIPT